MTVHIGPIVVLTGAEAREYMRLQNRLANLADILERDASNLKAVVEKLNLVSREQPAKEK